MSGLQPLTRVARSTAEIATPRADRYLSQLCKHFQHRCPVKLDDVSGHIAFSMGECGLRAQPGLLTLSLRAADGAQLVQLQDVVARHLVRFAFREPMQVVWRRE
jgi:hypothetical protein